MNNNNKMNKMNMEWIINHIWDWGLKGKGEEGRNMEKHPPGVHAKGRENKAGRASPPLSSLSPQSNPGMASNV